MSAQRDPYRAAIARHAGPPVRPLDLVAADESTAPRSPVAGSIGPVAHDAQPDADALPGPRVLAAQQVERARVSMARDLSAAPRWGFPDLQDLVGWLLPGRVYVVGARPANGKTMTLFSQAAHMADQQCVRVAYVPLEIDPEECRKAFAAWTLGYEQELVDRNAWGLLPTGAQAAMARELERQADEQRVHFCDLKRATLPALARWCRWAREEADCGVVMIDHVHRLDYGADGNGQRMAVTDGARFLKDMARTLAVPLIEAAQLNRSEDPLDKHMAPGTHRLKESAGLEEEADVILMLSRVLKAELPEKARERIKLGTLAIRDVEVPNAMRVTCRKHRQRNDAIDRAADLWVQRGRIWQGPEHGGSHAYASHDPDDV